MTWKVSYYTEGQLLHRSHYYSDSQFLHGVHDGTKRLLLHKETTESLLQGAFITQSRLLSRVSIITQQSTLILKIIT